MLKQKRSSILLFIFIASFLLGQPASAQRVLWKVVVTGVAYFFGSATVAHAFAQKHSVAMEKIPEKPESPKATDDPDDDDAHNSPDNDKGQ